MTNTNDNPAPAQAQAQAPGQPNQHDIAVASFSVAPRMTLAGLHYILQLLQTRPIAEAGELHASLLQQGLAFKTQAEKILAGEDVPDAPAPPNRQQKRATKAKAKTKAAPKRNGRKK